MDRVSPLYISFQKYVWVFFKDKTYYLRLNLLLRFSSNNGRQLLSTHLIITCIVSLFFTTQISLVFNKRMLFRKDKTVQIKHIQWKAASIIRFYQIRGRQLVNTHLIVSLFLHYGWMIAGPRGWINNINRC